MKILITPDKFKGSLTAWEVCDALTEGLLEIDPALTIVSIPLADGGEGTCDLLTEVSGGSKVNVTVLDPLSRPIASGYGISQDGKIAFIEMAKASGLQLLQPADRNPLKTSTIGTGQLIADALDRGVDKIILAVGGSATTDAGMGMAEALGFRFLSASGEKLNPVGKNLILVQKVTDRELHKRLAEVEVVVIFDVGNPLHGKQGAAHIFSPQKGATPEDVMELDRGLVHFAGVIREQYDLDINFRGAGAGGGLGGGALPFLNANFSPGIDFILEFTSLEKKVLEADLIITGEGKVDEQTFSGKVVQGVARLASKHQKPCIAFAGKSELTADRVSELGVREVVVLVDDKTTDRQAMENAFSLLKQKASRHLRRWVHSGEK